MKRLIKRKLSDFLAFNIVSPLRAELQEIVFQGLFNQQCLNYGLRNDFYPVGAAASYSLLYLLARILAEKQIENVIELGSGQTTILIDRIKKPGTRHICYEHDARWHGVLKTSLSDCDYRLAPLEDREVLGRRTRTYKGLEPVPFDLLIVDGPVGTETLSRIGCLELIKGNPHREFVLIFDDYGRPGEQQTVTEVTRLLRAAGLEFRLNSLGGRTAQAVITTPKYLGVSYYY